MPPQPANKVDATLFNRKERRKLQKRLKIHIPGRILPYKQSIHGTVKEYMEKRDAELLKNKAQP